MALLVAAYMRSLDMVSRLKGIETFSSSTMCIYLWLAFGYGFPFEGNWNNLLKILTNYTSILWICFPVWRELKRDELIRWEVPSRCQVFGYAFPFEGNWNSHPPTLLYKWYSLWICFPVWRELKPSATLGETRSSLTLWICFPVWRELKLN